MTSLPIYLGYKYFRSKKGAFASFTSIMAIAGLALGVAALVIVLSVMNGFERELQTRVLGVVPHLIIKNEESIENYDDSIARLIQVTRSPSSKSLYRNSRLDELWQSSKRSFSYRNIT